MELTRRACATICIFAALAALAGVHGGYEHHPRGVGNGEERPGDGDPAVLQGLTQDFEHVLLEFRELVEEEDSVVGEGDLAGARHGSPADQSYVGDGMVGGA